MLEMQFLSISEDILYFICGFGILQGLMLALLIYFHPKSDRAVNTYLALHILCVSLIMILPFAVDMLTFRDTYLVQPIPFLVGPFLYLYLKSFSGRVNFKKAFPHFLPFIVFFGLSYWNTRYLAHKYPDIKEISPELLLSPTTMILMYLRLVHLIYYYFKARQAINKYQRSIRQIYSETSNINLQWARVLVNGYLFLLIGAIIIFQLMFRFPNDFKLLLLINIALATPYIYIATFKGLSQPTLWQTNPGIAKEAIEKAMHEAEEIERQKVSTPVKSASRTTINDKTDDTVKRIIYLMENEKLYQETELTVQQLAAKLDLLPYQVSQAINDGMKRNFYDLVNSYRVEEAKQLLVNPKNQNFTILSIGFEAGFNSKTTFNTVFKKFTGLTPTEYRDQQTVEA